MSKKYNKEFKRFLEDVGVRGAAVDKFNDKAQEIYDDDYSYLLDIDEGLSLDNYKTDVESIMEAGYDLERMIEEIGLEVSVNILDNFRVKHSGARVTVFTPRGEYQVSSGIKSKLSPLVKEDLEVNVYFDKSNSKRGKPDASIDFLDILILSRVYRKWMR